MAGAGAARVMVAAFKLVLVRVMAGLSRGSSTKLENTRSFHIWCVAAALVPGQSRVFALGAAFSSLFLVGLQIILLTIVLQESSHPSCGAHTDCAKGLFCLAWDDSRRAPRCDDCFRLGELPYLNATICTEALVSPWRDIDESVSYLADPSRWSAGFRRTLADECHAWQHCRTTDIFPNECDHLMFKMDRLHWTAGLVLILLSFLMTLPLAEDMDEAAAEEALLDHQLRLGGQPPLVLVAAEILRVSLRIRSFLLSITISATAVAVIVAGSYTSSDILLNLLAASFITETDNMVATVFLPPDAHDRADALIKKITTPIALPWLEVRVRALVCVMSIAFCALKMPDLVEIFGDEGGEGVRPCSDIVNVVSLYPLYISVFFGLFLRPLSSVVMDETPVPGEGKPRRCRQAGRQLWLSSVSLCAGAALAHWGVAFFTPGSMYYLENAISLTIVVAISVAIEVFVHVRCAAQAGKAPPQAFTSSRDADEATASASVALPNTVVVAHEVDAEETVEVARFREEMLNLFEAEMVALKAENALVQLKVTALEAENWLMHQESTLVREKVSAVEAEVLASLKGVSVGESWLLGGIDQGEACGGVAPSTDALAGESVVW